MVYKEVGSSTLRTHIPNFPGGEACDELGHLQDAARNGRAAGGYWTVAVLEVWAVAF